MHEALILAAGKGTRMAATYNEVPKPLIKFLGISLMEYKIRALSAAGITKVTVITGYQSEQFRRLNVRLSFNDRYETTNMLYSLFHGLSSIDTDVVVCYGDIIFESDIVRTLLNSNEPFSVVFDKNFREYWSARMPDPVPDIESCQIAYDGSVQLIGGPVRELTDPDAQYIGMFKISKEFIPKLQQYWDLFQEETGQPIAEKSSVTSFLQWLILKGIRVHAVQVSSGWLEFDTPDDIEVYKKLYYAGKVGSFIDMEKITS